MPAPGPFYQIAVIDECWDLAAPPTIYLECRSPARYPTWWGRSKEVEGMMCQPRRGLDRIKYVISYNFLVNPKGNQSLFQAYEYLFHCHNMFSPS